MKTDKIEALLARIRTSLPEDSRVALVVILPADSNGESTSYSVDWGMGPDERRFAAECLTGGEKLSPRTVVTH